MFLALFDQHCCFSSAYEALKNLLKVKDDT